MASENKSIGISLYIDAETNDLLTEYAKRSGRSKRKEAVRRLKDHLLLFQFITNANVLMNHVASEQGFMVEGLSRLIFQRSNTVKGALLSFVNQ